MQNWLPLGADPGANQNYDYLLAQSEVYRQRHETGTP